MITWLAWGVSDGASDYVLLPVGSPLIDKYGLKPQIRRATFVEVNGRRLAAFIAGTMNQKLADKIYREQ